MREQGAHEVSVSPDDSDQEINLDDHAFSCLQAVLETEYDNDASLTLYHSLGFFREKRLHRFYLNGKDAYVCSLQLATNVGFAH
jgi:hypothetical protein